MSESYGFDIIKSLSLWPRTHQQLDPCPSPVILSCPVAYLFVFHVEEFLNQPRVGKRLGHHDDIRDDVSSLLRGAMFVVVRPSGSDALLLLLLGLFLTYRQRVKSPSIFQKIYIFPGLF